MQKFTIFNMPVALAIAASWTDYTEVPLSGEMCMFWWSPDPTFLDLSPVVVQFPPHNSREYAEGLLTSADAGAVVSTIVSRDLAALAPLVESFVDQIYIPLNEMNNILFDHKNTRDDWTDVTCRWIQANRDSWQKWMPDASKCSPGFGLYDTVERKFAHVRVNAQHDLVCEAGKLCSHSLTIQLFLTKSCTSGVVSFVVLALQCVEPKYSFNVSFNLL